MESQRLKQSRRPVTSADPRYTSTTPTTDPATANSTFRRRSDTTRAITRQRIFALACRGRWTEAVALAEAAR